MSIPLTASTESFTPECMAGMEGAPSFTFRHATELDRYEFGINITAEGLKSHSQEKVRGTILSELRRLFEGEGLERNITLLEAYWQADDDLVAAQAEHRKQVLAILSELKDDDEKPKLPPAPVSEFPQEHVAGIELMLAQVNEHSEILSLMAAQNLRYNLLYPRMLLRMFLVDSTLPVTMQRRGDVLTPACGEAVLTALAAEAKRLGVDPGTAQSELLSKAALCFTLTEDEEKNSSSPPSGSTSPKRSATKQSSGPQAETASSSSAPATSETDTGSGSSS